MSESIQSKLSKANIKSRYKYFDNAIKLLGQPVEVNRYKITVDKYGDDEDIQIISESCITLIIDYPSDIPLNRFRSDATDDTIDTTNLYLFDILPITAYVKFTDQVMKGDFIVHKFLDENYGEIKLVLRICEVLGGFDAQGLVMHKIILAPYNPSVDLMPDELQDTINNL